MKRLQQSDLKRLLAFVQNCYAIREFEPFQEFIPRLVAALLQLIPTAHVTYCEMYPEKSQSCNYISTPELATETMDRLWEQHMHEQPVLTHFLQVHDRHATRISDFWSQRQLHDSGLHRDFYRLGNIEDSLCIAVPCPPPRVVGIAWHGEGTFNDRQRLMADLVNSHISQAWQNARLLSRMQFQLQMLQHGMEDLGEGVILCGPRGRVQFINAKARGFLEEFFSTTRQTDRSLPEQILAWLRFQNQRLNKLDDAPPVRTPLIFEKEGKRLVIRLLSQEGMNLILMEEARPHSDTGSMEALGLTARETEVISWIARGKANGEIATILGMQIGTVKKHVEHIFEKLGVETRTAAAMALANGPS